MITIQADTAATEAALARLEGALADPFPLMSDIGELLTRSTKERFAQGVSPEGVKWAPKSQTTLERYGIRKSNRVDIRPLFGPSGALNTTIYPEPTRDEVLVGSGLIYAAVQQFGAAKGAFGNMANGSPIPWGNIPARPFLGVSAEDETGIGATVEDYLTGALRQ
jgi:phage virion morphogenesis protein